MSTAGDADHLKIGLLPPSALRPALLGDVQPPGILLPTDKYGAPFLVVGDANDPTAIFLDGQYKFQMFPRGTNDHWGGLAIEGLEFELNADSALKNLELFKPPGTMIRRTDQLYIVAIGERPFSRPTEVAIQWGLPNSTPNQEAAFSDWQAFIAIGERRFPVWRFSAAATQ